MVDKAQDKAFAKYVLHAGVVRIEHLEAAQDEQKGSDRPISQILVDMGAITPGQREDIEKRLSAGMGDVPAQLGEYRLLRKLGGGGMGAVYLGVDGKDRQVALKVLPKGGSDELLSRFRRETQAAEKLKHPNIATAYTAGRDAGHYYYVMEYCKGESLSQMIKRQVFLPEWQVVELIIPVAKALLHAHENHFVHRDIKPGNVMRGVDGSVKVLDMGLSKSLVEADPDFQTAPGMAVGTPHYISPEQARGDSDLDGRTDIYSLGATMFHLATGRTPFSGNTKAQVLNKHLSEPVQDPRGLNPELSDGFTAVVLKAMSKKREDRYESMAGLVADLERLVAGKPVKADLDRAFATAGHEQESAGTVFGGRFIPVLLLGVLLGVAAGVAIFLLTSGRGREKAPDKGAPRAPDVQKEELSGEPSPLSDVPRVPDGVKTDTAR